MSIGTVVKIKSGLVETGRVWVQLKNGSLYHSRNLKTDLQKKLLQKQLQADNNRLPLRGWIKYS